MRALKGVGAFSEEEDRLLALYVECHGGKGLKGCINWGGVCLPLQRKRPHLLVLSPRKVKKIRQKNDGERERERDR